VSITISFYINSYARSYDFQKTKIETRNEEEDEQAIKDGFEYVKDRDGVSLWRRPK
jgi:hypothetical protein